MNPSANISFVPAHCKSISSCSTYSLTLKCRTRMCFDLSLEMGFKARRFALISSPHSVGFFAVILKSVHNYLIHISTFAAQLIAISSASVVSPAMMSCLLERQNTQFPYILNTIPDTLFRLTPLAKSASDYTSTTLSFPEPLNVKATSIVHCRYLIICWTANHCFVALPTMCLARYG